MTQFKSLEIIIKLNNRDNSYSNNCISFLLQQVFTMFNTLT